MKKPLSLLLLAMLLLIFQAPAQADDLSLARARIAVLEKQLENAKAEAAALKAENAQLKRENQEMKREAVQPKLRVLPRSDDQRQPQSAGGYWITTSSGKRHNSSCRYYQNSKGRACGPGEGVACKICGG